MCQCLRRYTLQIRRNTITTTELEGHRAKTGTSPERKKKCTCIHQTNISTKGTASHHNIINIAHPLSPSFRTPKSITSQPNAHCRRPRHTTSWAYRTHHIALRSIHQIATIRSDPSYPSDWDHLIRSIRSIRLRPSDQTYQIHQIGNIKFIRSITSDPSDPSDCDHLIISIRPIRMRTSSRI